MPDIIDLIQADHREVEELLRQIEAASPEGRGDLFHALVEELARHEIAEQSVVHPALRDEVSGGGDVAEGIQDEESEAESALQKMEDIDAASDEFMTAFHDLSDDVVAHAGGEEREEHPRLRDALSDARLEEMAEDWRKVTDNAPSRPHPSTPQTPKEQAAMGSVESVFDMVRNVARGALAD